MRGGHKYGAKKCEIGGRRFASQAEGSLYGILALMEKGGLISELKCQPNVFLTKAKIRMIPDFSYVQEGALQYAEMKGFETPEWQLKKKLWKFYGPAPLHVWRGPYDRIFLFETIVPTWSANDEKASV